MNSEPMHCAARISSTTGGPNELQVQALGRGEVIAITVVASPEPTSSPPPTVLVQLADLLQLLQRVVAMSQERPTAPLSHKELLSLLRRAVRVKKGDRSC